MALIRVVLAQLPRPGQPGDRRRRHRVEVPLGKPHPHGARTRGKQVVGIEERDPAGGVIDGVVDVAGQLPAVDFDGFALVADLHRVERHAGSIAAALGAERQVQREFRRRTLAEQQVFRRAIERIVALRRCQTAVGERLRVREDHERILDGLAGLRIAGPRKHPVVDVEHRRIAGHRQPHQREEGPGRRTVGAFRVALQHRQTETGTDQRAPRDQVGLAHFVREDRRGRAPVRQVDQPQRCRPRCGSSTAGNVPTVVPALVW